MADLGITTPLLSSQPSDQVILTVHDDAESASQPVPQPGHEQRSPSQFHNHNNRNRYLISRNPFRFMGCEELNVPPPTTVDPFRNNTPTIEGVYEWLKIVVCIPIALVRLVIFGLCLLVGYMVTKLALEGWKDKQNPMPRWRCRLMWVTRICARCILFSFGYQWIKRKGKPAPREIAPIIVSNHVSYIEPIFYFYELFPTIVAAESHDSIPFVGTIIRAMQVIYVNRFIPSSRKQAVKEIKRRASCDIFPRVLLFPEGTTTNGRNLISFQLGAFIPGYPIQPVIVRYPHVHFDNSWGHISLAMLMFRMFTQFHNFFEVEYLPVISPLDKETAVHFAQRAAVTLSYPSDEPIKGKEYVTICWHDTLSFCICAPFALKTSHAIATALNTTQTGHSYGDIMLHTQAHEAKQVKPSIYMIEMAKVESLFRISSAEALEFLDKFLSMSPDPSGRVQFPDFSRVLGLKACPLSEEIFAFIDMEKSGSITFRQFLYGSAYVMKQPSFRQACELAFSKCSAAVKDYIVEQELRDSIQLAIPFLKEDEVHDLFILFDNDNDGRVSKDDFLSCLKRNPLLIALFNPQLQHQDLLAGNQAVEEIV